MKVIVAGGRHFNDYQLLESVMEQLLAEVPELEIVSGKARGADTLGETFARKHGLTVHPFPPDWDRLGKRAGFVRNEDMAKFSDALVAFWDGQSKGTQHMINLAKQYKLKVKVIRYETT